MKLKVAVDSLSLLSPLTGIGRYCYEISKELKKSDLDTTFYYGYFSKNLIEPADKKSVKSLKSVVASSPWLKKSAREMLFFFTKFSNRHFDIYWQPNFIPNPNIKAKKVVTTVHDFSFFLHKEFIPKERIKYFEKYFLKNINLSDAIITGSNFTKQEILERLNFKSEDVHVIYHGVDHSVFKLYSNPKTDFKLPKKFILSVGSIEPRKNLLGLLKAYLSLDNSIKKEYKLVLAGFKGWENSEIVSIIKQNSQDIFYLGYLSNEELAKVYNLSSCFVFPSFYEGFGLPILEAMACGAPVICSNSSSMPEVGGDAALYCNPKDIDDIAKKIEAVLSSAKLQQEMAEKGLNRAKKFSWEKSAHKHIQIFNKVIKS